MTSLPQRIGNYKLERRIGKGGSGGEVWLARHRSLEGRQVAIKLIVSNDDELIERFTREANITSRLRHEHIIQIYDHGEQPPYYYTVMEYVSGGALRDWLQGGKPLPLDLALQIFRCAGAALDYAHTNGVIHRDVSPGNILIEPEASRVLLTDFGIAREPGKAGLTTISRVMGTPGYLSPEHARSATAVTYLSDIYSLGIVLFEMLSGKRPWEHNPGAGPDADGGSFADPRTLRDVGVTHLPPDVERVIQTMLAFESPKRYPNALAAVVDLERIMTRHSSPTQIVGQRSNPTKTVAPATNTPAVDVEPTTVERVLGRDLLKEPIEAAKKRDDQLLRPGEIERLLNEWSVSGRFRRRLLGRQSSIHTVKPKRCYFYTLSVLYETREPAKTTEQPVGKEGGVPHEKVVDRWSVELPATKGFQAQSGAAVRLPGSSQIIKCQPCSGNGQLICPRCQGKGQVLREPTTPAPTTSTTRSTSAPGNSSPIPNTPIRPMPPSRPDEPGSRTIPSASSTVRPTTVPIPTAPAAPRMMPCPDCGGKAQTICKACQGNGTLLQFKTIDWKRRALAFENNDELHHDPKQEAQLLSRCEAKEIYREQCTKGYRGEWRHIPELAALIERADAELDQNSRVVLTEVVISFIPYTLVVIDLGEPERNKPALPTTKQPTNGLETIRTYDLPIVGFENVIPHDWRFLSWAHVLVWLLTLLSIVLAALLTLSLFYR
jgi:serine/threonine protein kinase